MNTDLHESAKLLVKSYIEGDEFEKLRIEITVQNILATLERLKQNPEGFDTI